MVDSFSTIATCDNHLRDLASQLLGVVRDTGAYGPAFAAVVVVGLCLVPAAEVDDHLVTLLELFA